MVELLSNGKPTAFFYKKRRKRRLPFRYLRVAIQFARKSFDWKFSQFRYQRPISIHHVFSRFRMQSPDVSEEGDTNANNESCIDKQTMEQDKSRCSNLETVGNNLSTIASNMVKNRGHDSGSQVLGMIPYGGRPLGNRQSDSKTENVDEFAQGDRLFDHQINGYMIAYDPYADIPAYQRLKLLKQSILMYKQRNSDIVVRIRQNEHDNSIQNGRITELHKENERLIEENARNMEKSLENRYLEKNISATKRNIEELSSRIEQREQEHIQMLRDCHNYKTKQRQLISECRGLELTSLTNNYKTEKLTQRRDHLESFKQGQRTRMIMTDQWQSSEGCSQVFVRIRANGRPSGQLRHLKIPTSEQIELPASSYSTIAEADRERQTFRVNKVLLPSTTQAQLFQQLSHLVDTVVDDRSVCLLSYGASATGKTYSLIGDEESRGFLSRAVVQILRRVKSHQFTRTDVLASFIQIHAEKASCLLSGERVKVSERKDMVAMAGHKSARINNATEFSCLLDDASQRRSRSALRSMSHMIVFLKLVFTNSLIDEKTERFLVVCDLCALTQLSDSESDVVADPNARLNSRALISLQQVISAINSGSATVPFRQSVLTHFLKPCLSGGALCAALLTIEDHPEAVSSNLHTLRFGELLMTTALGRTENSQRNSVLKSLQTTLI